MPQLALNQGPQDALLYDNTKSYFSGVGYVRTSNFQIEYKNVESQNAPKLGNSVTYVIPKSGDYLGCTDLRIKLHPASLQRPGASDGFVKDSIKSVPGKNERIYAQWVDELGYAMIEKAVFSIGSVDIETKTGEQLQIANELHTSDEMRLTHQHTLKTGRRAFRQPAISDVRPGANELPSRQNSIAAAGVAEDASLNGGSFPHDDFTRIIKYHDNCSTDSPLGTEGGTTYGAGQRELIIPLGFFFTRHASQFFPLNAIAGCNEIRVTIKFRSFKELVQMHHEKGAGASGTDYVADSDIEVTPKTLFGTDEVIDEAKLFCHYVHVTGPEANLMMNREHVRLLKLWQHHGTTVSLGGSENKNLIDMDLSFMHPVNTLYITIRRQNDMTSSVQDEDGAQKGYFFYHGDGTNPNYDRAIDNAGGNLTHSSVHTVKVKNIALHLNGTERHPGLDQGIDTKYINARLLAKTFSNSNQYQKQLAASVPKYSKIPATYTTGAAAGNVDHRTTDAGSMTVANSTSGITQPETVEFIEKLNARIENAFDKEGQFEATPEYQHLQMKGCKNIFVYPFSLNPEGVNPTGAVNFSKVSHAKLRLTLDTPSALQGPLLGTAAGYGSYKIDVYAVYYNWLQIKNGRGLLSFA